MSRSNRRDFLKKSALLAGGVGPLSLSSCSPPFVGPLPKGARVAVVGAGLSGLACANGLFQRGFDVSIYEASSRVGGRVHSLSSTGFEGAELGASFLHGGPENPLRQFCEKHSFDIFSFHHTDIDLVKPQKKPEPLKPLRIHWDEFDILLDELAQTAFLKTWLRRHLSLPFKTQYLAPILNQLFQNAERELFQRPDIQRLLKHLTTQLFATPFNEIPMQNYLVEPRVDGVGHGPFAENESILSNGLQSMVEKMSEALDIKYNHVLNAVEQTQSGLKLKGNWGESEVDFCVLCLPLGVLQKGIIDFDFDLPKPWVSALDKLVPGEAEKIVFKFPQGQLEGLSSQSLFFLLESQELFVQNLHSFKNNGILVGYLTGHQGRQLVAKSKKQLREFYTKFFQRFMPGLKNGDLEIYHSNWVSSEFFKGAYSSLGPRSKGYEHSAFRQMLHPHLLLAGEYAHPTDPGTMQGAYWSGLWAAEQLLGRKLGAF